MTPGSTIESQILPREQALRAWFTRDADLVLAQIDGLDIGWGGIQRWATAHLPDPAAGPHLDLACGYGTFLAQLGWRFPAARLVGLNIDFAGPHALIDRLLAQAGVSAELVQADARRTPFGDEAFGSASCFLGLQDIQIGFGQAGVREVLVEAVRILRRGGLLTLLDEFTFEQLAVLLEGLPVTLLDRRERALDVRWDRQVAERAITLYAQGWVAQTRTTKRQEKRKIYQEVHTRMRDEMERQLRKQGYYVPFGPVRMVVVRKSSDRAMAV